MADLITDGVPIRGEAGVGYVLGEGYDLPPLMFKSDELEAIMLGLSWVSRRDDKVLQIAAEEVVTKIGTVVPEAVRPLFYDATLFAPPKFGLVQDRVYVGQVRASPWLSAFSHRPDFGDATVGAEILRSAPQTAFKMEGGMGD